MTEWAGTVEDPFSSIIAQLIGDALQPRVIDLSGVPNEIAGVSRGAFPISRNSV